jgi:hypothetical protein
VVSAPINHSEFGLQSDEPIVITATLWRGAMIDRYAQIEFFIDRTLDHCVEAGIVQRKDADTTLPRQRCKVLIDALGHPHLLAKGNHARQSLELVYSAWDRRNALCHGRLKPAAKSVSFHWTAREKLGAKVKQDRVTPAQMLEQLRDLDRLKTTLGSQLGAIDKVCADAST